MISIVTPSYNQGRFIEETIKSVLSQEGDFQLDYIIVDGGSTDDTVEIIKKYERLLEKGKWPVRCKGIRFRWVSEKDQGQSDAITKGFAMAEGTVITWLNSDDTYLNGAIADVMHVFKDRAGLEVVYGMAYFTDESGVRVGKYPTGSFDRKRLATFNFICQPSTFFTRTALEKAGGIDTGLHYVMDYDLWIRISNHFSFEFLQEYLATYRLHTESKTVSARHALENQRECLATVMKYYHWAPANRVYGYCYHRVKNALPSSLAKTGVLIVIPALICSAVKYLYLNRGIRLYDLRTFTLRNLRKMSMDSISIYKEYGHESR